MTKLWPKRATGEPGAQDGPTLVVVMAVLDVAPYVEDAITSVATQRGVRLTLVVVDDGSTDGTRELVRKLARRHANIVYVTQEHAGLGAARNHGLAQASGDYIAFADGDDVVPQGAYALMVDSLEATGSDVCTGAIRRFDQLREWEPAWSREVHAEQRVGVTLAQYPWAIKDVLACNRVIRRAFWDVEVGEFPENIIYEDHEPMLRTLVHASGIDLLSDVVYHWRLRDDGSSTAQQKHEISNLRDRLTVKRRAWAMLNEDGVDDVVRTAWLGRVLDVDLPPFVGRAIEADEHYRAELGAAAQEYLRLAPPESLPYVRGQQRARMYLAAHGQWDVAQRLQEEIERDGVRGATVLEDGALRLAPALTPGVPDELREMADYQVRATARLRKASRTDGGWELRGVVSLTPLHLGRHRAVAHVWLVVGDDVAAFPGDLSVRRGRDDESPTLEVAVRLAGGEVPTTAASWPVAVQVDVLGLARSAALRVPAEVAAELERIEPQAGDVVVPVVDDGVVALRVV
ncbi:glycosyltransferase family 2 protein [Cellulomonas rhizosphaerae]|uniref:glycosyltransferase family 2 protein n=1 Tax=Cellulomonas rhizosphaerae TaxID=2293719 RepID=UPI0010FDB38F|nr:glycosyltransferase family 2 protein [Cellulomonas rhizosphaerae]